MFDEIDRPALSLTLPPRPRVRDPPGNPPVGPCRVLHDVDESKELLEETEASAVAEASPEGSDVTRWGADPSSHAHGYCDNDDGWYDREHKALLCGAQIHSSDALTVSDIRVTAIQNMCDTLSHFVTLYFL